MSDKLMFSIIVATYNRSDLIRETLESLTGQTYKNFEVIVVDDGSKDNTEQVMQDWVNKDSRIRYFKKENGERGAARNFGINQAQGMYITFIDSDDVAYAYALQTAFEQLTLLEWPECFALAYEIRDKKTMELTLKPMFLKGVSVNKALLGGNILSCIGVFIRKEILEKHHFEEDREFAGSEDWLLWLTIAARYRFTHFEKICFCMYQHDNRSVMDFPEAKLKYRAEQLKQKLETDSVFIKAYGPKSVNKIYAHMLSYASLHLAMCNRKKRALQYIVKAASINIGEIWTRRTLGIFKTILLK